MSRRAGPAASGRYELRVEGHLDDRWAAWFGALAITREADGTTTMHAVADDAAELHGLLAKVRDLGATLISLVRIDAEATRRQSGATLPALGVGHRGTPVGHGDVPERRPG